MSWVNSANSALLTDLYELTMAASYQRRGMNDSATFDLFVRDLPARRNFMVVAGLEQALSYLEELRFDKVHVAAYSPRPGTEAAAMAEQERSSSAASAAEPGGAVHKKMARDRVRQREYARRLPPVKVARIVDHIDHIVKLVGMDHVGIGSDFDGVQITIADLATVAELPNLTKELLRRGYSESDVSKILGGNMLRVMEAVQLGPGQYRER